LCYNLANMHKITPNIHEEIAFTKWLSVNQIPRKFGAREVFVPRVQIWLYNTDFKPCHQEQFLF
jgi:hypothetical protein